MENAHQVIHEDAPMPLPEVNHQRAPLVPVGADLDPKMMGQQAPMQMPGVNHQPGPQVPVGADLDAMMMGQQASMQMPVDNHQLAPQVQVGADLGTMLMGQQAPMQMLGVNHQPGPQVLGVNLLGNTVMNSSVLMGSEYDGRRIIQKQNEDLFSKLPEEMLSHILSQLPAKWAVRASILSKRWRNLWTYITCLDFKNHTDSLRNSNVVKFTNFVGHVFRRCNPKHIQKLILHFPWNGPDESRFITWLDEWLKHRVNELDLLFFKFPLRVLSCTNLTVLTLDVSHNHDAHAISFNLPFLKVLRINGRLSHLMENLISGCPVLEDLTLGGSGAWYMTDTFTVSADTLKTLRLQLKETIFSNSSRKISVEAPKLVYLHLSETFIDYNITGIFSSVLKAYVSIGNISMGHHFQDIPCRFTLPSFDSLTYLEVISCDNRFWAMLPKFIRSTPSLKVLSLKQKDGHEYGTDDEYVIDDEYDWVEPKSVAFCVGHRLRAIKVEGFKGRKHELQLVKYFLGSAKILETLTVSCEGLKTKEEIKLCGQLRKFSRDSKCWEVHFHENFISLYRVSLS